jgi:hypothetical protein
MSTLMNEKWARPFVFLASEFVVIVLGVLAALAVDEWREARDEARIRSQIVSGLIADLENDTKDYEQVLRNSQLRLGYANALLDGEIDSIANRLPQGVSAGQALYEFGVWPRLETSTGTYEELTASGAGRVIDDITLRLQISQYYARARNRADINMLTQAVGEQFNDELLRLGFSFADRDAMDVDAVLGGEQVRVTLRSYREFLPFVARVAQELIDEDKTLREALETYQADAIE